MIFCVELRLRSKLLKILNYWVQRNFYKIRISHTLTWGFSLVELLIALAIIAILAVFAIPAYQDYLQRARFSAGVIFAQKTLSDVYDYQTQHGVFPDNNSQLKLESAISDNDVGQIVVGSGGNVCAVFNGVHLSGVVMLVPSLSGGNSLVVDSSLAKYAPSGALVVPTAIIPCEGVAALPTPDPVATPSPAASAAPSPTPTATATAAPSPSPSPSPAPVLADYQSWWAWLIAFLRWLIS